MTSPSYSIVITAKDEEKALPVFLASVAQFCQDDPDAYEVIVVNDGSCDNTTTIARTFKNSIRNLSVLDLDRNHGKGYAVRHGFEHARGHILIFIDADGSTPIQEISRQQHWFDQGYDIVIGSREKRSPGSTVNAKQYRKCIGRVFNCLVHAVLIPDIQDTQCGFKMFRRETASRIMPRLTLDGFGFDLEILFIAKQLHCRIKETAVNWTHIPGSKVNLWRDSWRMFLNIFTIRQRHAMKF